MKISFQPHIQKINTRVLTNKPNNTGFNKDSFIKSTVFKGISDNKSFDEFDKWAKRENFIYHARDIIDDPNNYLGKDFEGHIYTIPNCNRWVIKKHQDKNLMPFQVKETTYTQIDDISPNINIGQAIASLRVPYSPRITEHYYIHKAQEGGPIGLQRGLMKNINSATARKHIESLSQVSMLNQESFDKLIDDIKKISDMGFNFDGNEPNNLILSQQEKQINITGLTKDNNKNVGQFSEVLYALLGGNFAENFRCSHRPEVEKKNAEKYSNTICAKFFISMKNNNCKFELTDNLKNLINSATFTNILKTSDNVKKLERLRSVGLI